MKPLYYKLILFLFIVSLIVAAIWLTDPFKNIIGSYSASLEGLTSSQRKNICLATKRISGKRLNPGDEFSFNALVGSRTLENGFYPARALYERMVVESIGGGICLVSSTLYNAVIRAGLNVVDRTAHTNVVGSMPAGMDATVWYGVSDLKFKNTLGQPVKVVASCGATRLNIEIRSKLPQKHYKIYSKSKRVSQNILQVCVYRQNGAGIEKLSEDIYLTK